MTTFEVAKVLQKDIGWGYDGTKAIVIADTKEQVEEFCLRKYGVHWYINYYVQQISEERADELRTIPVTYNLLFYTKEE